MRGRRKGTRCVTFIRPKTVRLVVDGISASDDYRPSDPKRAEARVVDEHIEPWPAVRASNEATAAVIAAREVRRAEEEERNVA